MSRVVAMCALLSWLLPADAGGQTLDEAPSAVRAIVDQLPEQLKSDDPKDVAWAAFHAGQYQVRSAIPLLEATFDRFRAPQVPAIQAWDSALWHSVLDSLVLLNAQVDANAVIRFFQRWPVQTLILLNSARTDRDEALLAILDLAPDGNSWRAAAGLALTTKLRGFAVYLLREQTWRLTMNIVDRGDRVLIGGGGASETSGCHYVVPVPAGYPPIATYQLPFISIPSRYSGNSWPDSSGRLFHLRMITDRLPGCVGPGRALRPSSEDRLAYIAALLNTTREQLVLSAAPFATVAWTNAESLKVRIAQERRQLADRYRGIVTTLVVAGHLTQSEAVRLELPSIDVHFSDQRSDRSEPLPAIGDEK